MKLKNYILLVALLTTLPIADAKAWSWGEWYEDLKINVADTWACGRLDVYTPFYA